MFRSAHAAKRLFSTASPAVTVFGAKSNSHAFRGAAALAASVALASLALVSNNSPSSSKTHYEGAGKHSLLEEMSDRVLNMEDLLITYAPFLAQIKKVKESNPTNLTAKHFNEEYFKSLSHDLKERLYRVVKSGVENPDSGMGCYAMFPQDYDVLKPFFEVVIKEYHKIPGQVHHVTNWDLSSVPKGTLPEDGKLDLSKLGLGTTSMRVRVGRNLEKFPLPGAQTKAERIQMENELIEAFEKLMKDEKFGGSYYSLTPGNKYEISKEKYDSLVKGHVMFKDMGDDSYLASAGISSDWPYGRGAYQSADGGFIIWVGEEDHLRIMCMKKGIILNDVFDRLKNACDEVEKITGKFAHSKDFGYVTSCPTNLGTGMRASIHIKVPNLTADGTDTKAKEICKPLGLSVRGLGGEHTPIGADGTIDLSPSARLMITEAEIIAYLYKGIRLLLEAENAGQKSKI